LCEGEPPKEPTGSAQCWVTNDVDGYYETAISHGLEIMFPPQFNEKYKIYHFYFKDPDGHTIEVQRFEDPLE
jgi:catechol 2,3-dioxygenase-like lactoylglutathione lyase family enzyme